MLLVGTAESPHRSCELGIERFRDGCGKLAAGGVQSRLIPVERIGPFPPRSPVSPALGSSLDRTCPPSVGNLRGSAANHYAYAQGLASSVSRCAIVPLLTGTMSTEWAWERIKAAWRAHEHSL